MSLAALLGDVKRHCPAATDAYVEALESDFATEDNRVDDALTACYDVLAASLLRQAAEYEGRPTKVGRSQGANLIKTAKLLGRLSVAAGV